MVHDRYDEVLCCFVFQELIWPSPVYEMAHTRTEYCRFAPVLNRHGIKTWACTYVI